MCFAWRGALAVVVLVLAAAPAALAAFDSNAAATTTFATATLSPASTLSATRGACTPAAPWVSLSWTASASTWATGYEVLRSLTAGGPHVPVATVVGVTTTTYEDGPLLPSTTYWYVVRATKGLWRSAFSDEASITTASALC